MGLGAGMAGMICQAMQQPQAAPTAGPADGGLLTRDQVLQAIDALDLRFSKGEVSEQTYNRLMQKWEARLKELGG